jgi:hypothetical protein
VAHLDEKFEGVKIQDFVIKTRSKLGLDSNLLLGSKNLKNKFKKKGRFILDPLIF